MNRISCAASCALRLGVFGLVVGCSSPRAPIEVQRGYNPPQNREDSVKVSKDFFERGYGEYLPGHYDSSLALLEIAVSYNSANAEAWQVKACCLAHKDEFLDSRAAFDTAIRIRPRYVAAWWHRGCLHASTGAVDTALANLQTAIDIDSSVKSWPFGDDCWKSLRKDARLLAVTGPPPEE